jgi:hypothetical protein
MTKVKEEAEPAESDTVWLQYVGEAHERIIEDVSWIKARPDMGIEEVNPVELDHEVAKFVLMVTSDEFVIVDAPQEPEVDADATEPDESGDSSDQPSLDLAES